MSTVEWTNVFVQSVADATETALTTITVAPLAIHDVVALFAFMDIDAADADTTGVIINVRRGSLVGDVVANVPQLDLLGTSLVNDETANGPFFDGPGLPSSLAYVLTVTCTGATGPTTGIKAVLGASYG